MDDLDLHHSPDSMEDSSELLASSEPPDKSGILGDPEAKPRVGDEYQVNIPFPLPESERSQFATTSNYPESVAAKPVESAMGLPIPVMLVNMYVDKKSKDEGNLEHELHHTDAVKSYCLAPGSVGESWTEMEEASFLLGLYIFGKNLVLVKKFIESKSMGDILSFYYGEFYKSDKYRRWSDCRKMRSRRCIYGQKIFNGPRQQELMSRLLSRVSEECKTALLESSKAFGDGTITLESYVFALKDMLGINNLIEAVGIGKGKQDLTGMCESAKLNQGMRPEIPVGKACSTLTTEEVVEFLTGDFRLSKARTSDLFWEAVWPRLLASGWHSEEPRDYIYIGGSKHSLVFLMPGIKKFSRRKLVKGQHYLDSITDVLNRVAKDPTLLEFHSETNEGDGSKATNEVKLENDEDHEPENGNSPDQQRRSYLQPRTVRHDVDIVEFTVVDTSLFHGNKGKVREVRCLPMKNLNTPMSKSRSKDSERISSTEATEDLESGNALCSKKLSDSSKRKKILLPKAASSDWTVKGSTSKRGVQLNGQVSTSMTEEFNRDQTTHASDDKQPRKSKKCRLNQGMSADGSFDIPPVVVAKRPRKPSVCNRPGPSQATRCYMPEHHGSKAEVLNQFGDRSFDQNISSSQVDPSKGKISSSSSPHEHVSQHNVQDVYARVDTNESLSHEKLPPRSMIDIDLNLPVPMDVESEELYGAEMKERDVTTSEQPDNLIAPNAAISLPNVDQGPNMNSRRQSTRNRPLTAKALDAIADGYFEFKPKRKRGDLFSNGNPMSRPPRRARARTAVNESSLFIIDDTKEEVKPNGASTHDSNRNAYKFLVEADEDDVRVLDP